MTRLTAASNPVIKEVRSLKNKSDREDKGLYFIEGTRFVSEAFKENASIRYIIFSETFLSGGSARELTGVVEEMGITSYEIPDSLFGSISDTQNPQGVLAVLELEKKLLRDTPIGEGTLILLDNIRDPGNMGTIIRTADAAGCSGVALSDGCADIYNPKVLRSTMGSIFHIPVCYGGGIVEMLQSVKQKGFKLCASHLEGSVSIYEADLSGNTALIIGSEAEGISDDTAKKADLLVKIPMAGRAESLNASVAAGVMMFEAMRQRQLR